jgi:uncharacterized membrane protein
MFLNASDLFRGICISSTLYGVLFLLHILAAAQDWDTVFKIIAALITLMTFTVGPSIIVLGKIKNRKEKIQANTIGHSIGLILAIGLAWAYADQSFDILLTLAFILITGILHSSHRMMLNQ